MSPPNERANYNAHLVSHWAAVRCTFNLSPFVLAVSPTAEEGGEVVEEPFTSATEPSLTLITMEPDACIEKFSELIEGWTQSQNQWYLISLRGAKLCVCLHMWLICASVPSAVFGTALVFSVMLSMMTENQAARISNRRLHWHCAPALLEIMSGVVIFKYCLQGLFIYPVVDLRMSAQ